MRIMVLCDDYWHPASTVRQGLSPLAAQGYEFEWVADAREWSAGRMDSFPLVILSKSNNVSAADQSAWVTRDVEEAFRQYVRSGHGLLVTHSGTVYKDYLTLRGLLGGAFLSHPKQCPVTVKPLAGRRITAGVGSFTETDEHYVMQLDDTHATVFMTSESGSAPEQPAGWTRREGAGRVCVLTPGHNVDVWLHPDYQALLANALRWCSPAH